MTLIYCINIKLPSSLNGLEKYIFKYLIKMLLNKLVSLIRLEKYILLSYNPLPSSFNSLEKYMF